MNDSSATERTASPTNSTAGTVFIEVRAGVRYWEDADVNGEEDADGSAIPLRQGDVWAPVINLDTGGIIDWPDGTIANIHYKVCDEGEYWLLDRDRQRISKYKGCYVPDEILCVGDAGYGDYIILKVGQDGFIKDWRRPQIDAERWSSIAPAAPSQTEPGSQTPMKQES